MSSRIISQNYILAIFFLTKNVPSFDVALLHPPGVDCPPYPWTFMRNPWDGGESYPTANNLLISPTKKISLIRFTSSAIKSDIPSPSNSHFHVITLYKLHLWLQSLLLYLFFLTSGSMYTHVMLILIIRCLPNIFDVYHDKSIEWSKFSQAKFPFSQPFNVLWETLLLLMLVFLFSCEL